MIKRTFFIAALTLGVAILLLNPSLQGQGNAKPDIRGVVKTATINKNSKDVLGSILVEGPKGQTYDKAVIRITKETKIFKLEGKERKAGTIADLKVGVQVEATFVGPVAESYPVQAKGGEIVVLPAAKK